MCILGGYLGIWNMLELLVMTWMLTAVVAGLYWREVDSKSERQYLWFRLLQLDI